MIEIVAGSGTETTGQAGGPSLAATMPVETHRGCQRLSPRQAQNRSPQPL